MNQVVLTATLAQMNAMRYTPAGVPAIEFLLEHESQQSEAGQQRVVKAAVKAVAFGALAERIASQHLGSPWQFTGFLASSRNGKSIAFHVTDLSQE